MTSLYRLLPSVDSILAYVSTEKTYGDLPRAFIRDLVNDFLEVCREEIRAGAVRDEQDLDPSRLKSRLEAYLKVQTRPHFRRVINATGVVIHTNLGRSILNKKAAQAVWESCLGYSNLEFSLDTGKRGSRYSHVEELLCRITGAEAGLVVNNNASAVLIILDTLAKGKEVVVSRGQLVEIGGSFRIPEVMAKSGAILKEVGATNRTHLKDYQAAINEQTGALLKVHTSNYRIIGFHKEVSLKELVVLGEKYGLPVIEDMGSGNFFDFAAHGYHFMVEPTVQQVVKDGVSVVSFSGDKLLGGPQAGIIVGKKEFIDQIKKNPMNRAIRIDKMTLAALESTLRFYLDPLVAMKEVPTLRMITMKAEEIKKEAHKLRSRIKRNLGQEVKLSILPAQSRVGGGAFPEQDLPTWLVGIKVMSLTCDQLKEKFLRTDPPLIGRIEDDFFCLDPRTISSDEYSLVCDVLKQALK
ncbi:L-seryl-tRNA(Sec) selenium transferase [Desulfonatronovibrio hydrogenovorans]|uniref:L-seryl-tRNA(Sec) selenium transferase n=1 Tax=Desulfonatronovibrio hydrogenovorans TaxID=53245 RepID=UPI00048E16F9|nr:L-seryl-tRNA(Sec) selenium transferase [Desulfonatronovibrio hydrogenovorans]